MESKVEAWTALFTPALSQSPLGLATRAQTLEGEGWDGAAMFDSQAYTGDVFTVLGIAAAQTTSLKLGTGTSNVVTRHPAVLANAAATVHAASGGRMTLGVGRGDSSLSALGAGPTRVAQFESTLKMVREYLRGPGVPIDMSASLVPGAGASVGTAMNDESMRSQLMWLPDELPALDLEVTASGPKVIALAARHADRIAFCVGADADLLAEALSIARAELDRCGRSPDSVRFSAYMPLFPHDDEQVAKELSANTVSQLSQYSSAPREDFAVAGKPDQCVERINELASMGIDRFHFWTADEQDQPGESYASVIENVLPHIAGRRLGQALD